MNAINALDFIIRSMHRIMNIMTYIVFVGSGMWMDVKFRDQPETPVVVVAMYMMDLWSGWMEHQFFISRLLVLALYYDACY